MRSGRNRTFIGGFIVLLAAAGVWWWQTAGTAEPTDTEPAIAGETARDNAADGTPVQSAGLSMPGAEPAEPVDPLAQMDPVVVQMVPSAARPPASIAPPASTPTPDDEAAEPAAAPSPDVPPLSAAAPVSASPPVPTDPAAASGAIGEATAALASGDTVRARALLSKAVDPTADVAVHAQAIQTLERLAEETLWSPRIVAGDPLVGNYTIQKGDSLVRIARRHKITVPLLAQINRIKNPNLIQLNQNLKVINGPFHAVVCKRTFRMYLYCQDVLVKVVRVGLGAEGTTPTGVWKVKNKLENPTYYDPRGNGIIQADDPQNPLGEYWLGLEGIEGEAVGQERYGIHGTIEPDSIGRNVSMGCIRLGNEDIAAVYRMLIEDESTVTVRD